MVTVAEAAAALGIDERTVREKLSKEEWKGEKRMIGMKEKWFMYRGELDRQVERLKIVRQKKERIPIHAEESDDLSGEHETAEQDPQFETLAARVQELEALLKKNSVEESPPASSDNTAGPRAEEDVIDAVISGDGSSALEDDAGNQKPNDTLSGDTRSGANAVADALWNNLICRFQEKLEEKDQLIGEYRAEIAEKDRQLKLLPDLQKQATEEMRQQAEAVRKAAELKELEAEALRKQVDAMQIKQTEVELAKQKIAELEKSQAESLRKAEEEIQRLTEEKEAHAKAVQEQLEALSATVQELQKPKPSWFEKWFLLRQEQ